MPSIGIERTWKKLKALERIRQELFAAYVAFVPEVKKAGGFVCAKGSDRYLKDYIVDFDDGFSEGVTAVDNLDGRTASPLGETVHAACLAHREASIQCSEAQQKYEEAWRELREQFEKEEKS